MAEDLIDRLQDISHSLGKLQATMDNQTRDIAELKAVVILGNGEPSLVSRMVSVEQKVSVLVEAQGQQRASRLFFIGLAVPTIISVISIVKSW